MSLAHRRLPFSEQIRFFRGKLNIPTQSYADIYGAEHDAAFVVAGMARMDMLADMRQAVDKSIAGGMSLAKFRKSFDSIVARYGWQYNGGRDWRSRIIYDTNLYSSYQAGRYEQQQSIKHLRPYWEYQHLDGQKHPRPEHEAWDGLVLHADDPWWQTHYPINAYGCKCTVFAHSERSLARNGLKVGKAPPVEMHTVVVGKNSANPRMVAVPKGIDPGFDRIPGKDRERAAQMLLEKAKGVPPKMASTAVSATLAHAQVRRLLNAEVAEMVDTVAREKVARGVNKSVGVILPEIIEALTARDMAPATAVITLRDRDILHALRDDKHQPLPVDFWRNIAEHIAAPEAVLLMKNETPPVLLYIYDLGGDKGKMALKMDYDLEVRTPEGKRKIKGNILRTGSMLYTQDEIESLKGHIEIWKK
ncbi:MAG: phage minor head protein [Cardiobacteriaceae bacterium]|nr:phage minor head protein [Cardiobacteriaceae bacterium]